MLFMSDIILGEHNRSYDHTKDHMITSTKIVAVISTHCCVCDIIKLPWLCMALAIVDTRSLQCTYSVGEQTERISSKVTSDCEVPLG